MSSLNNLQECLLYAFSAYVTGDGRIFAFSRDFINFVNENNSALCRSNVSVRSIDELEKNVLYVFTYISGFRERRCVCNGKRNVQFLCKCFCKQCFSRTRRTYKKNV